jgi:hypothetical protein
MCAMSRTLRHAFVFDLARVALAPALLTLVGCAVAGSDSGEAAGEKTGKARQLMTASNDTYHHGGNLWAQDYEIVQGGACWRAQKPNSFSVSNTGGGSCWGLGWNNPADPTDCRVRVHIHDDAFFSYGDCHTVVDQTPVGQPDIYANSFEGDPHTAGTNANKWWFAGTAGIDVNAGLAIPGQTNDGWARSTSGWNALNTWIPTTPGMVCSGQIWVRTSSPNFGTGFVSVNDEANTRSLTGLPAFGVLTGDAAHAGYAPLSFSFTAVDSQELFFVGFWGNGADAWLQADDLQVTCLPQLHNTGEYDTQTGPDLYFSGNGFVDGDVQLWYLGIPNYTGGGWELGGGWQYGGVVHASGHAFTSAEDTTLDTFGLSACTADQRRGVVSVMGVDSAQNESAIATIPASYFCVP